MAEDTVITNQMTRPEMWNLGSDLSKVNPAELAPEDIKTYQKALQDSITKLEHRYDEPNWFKVAAGFAKPQLGGFVASLGSAANAMGDTVEARRAQELPVAQMRAQLGQSQMMLGQKVKQNDIYQQWKASGQPMDAETYSRIMSLGKDTDVAHSATSYYTGAKSGLEITGAATDLSSKFPQLAGSLNDFTNFQLSPNADPAMMASNRQAYMQKLEAARPPQIDPTTWAAMGTYDKQNAAEKYARAQTEMGMGVENTYRQQAGTAPDRLTLLHSIRDLALGTGLEPTKDAQGNMVSGQQQMASLLNYFGGNNPMDVIARAASEGKLNERLTDFDRYARQLNMSPEARDRFQALVKLLAENQVSLRGGSVNPTDAYTSLQTSASPNINNSQKALVTLVDLMGHGEQNAINRYKYIKEHGIPYGQLEYNQGYTGLMSKYAQEHAKIATEDPTLATPSWYSPSESTKPKASTAPQAGQKPVTVTLKDIEAERARRAQSQNP